MSRRLVHYSLYLNEPIDTSARARDLVEQLDASLTTLRRHNPSIDVAVFHHGRPQYEVEVLVAGHDVRLIEQPDYVELLDEVIPAAAPFLKDYPLLHKFANFNRLAEIDPGQTLYVDCDTLFFDDVDRLFDNYGGAHIVAREEPFTRRSPHGHDPTYIDETAFETLLGDIGLTSVAPFNTGVVMMNRLLWREMTAVGRLSIEVAWRYVVWMALTDHQRGGRFGRLDPVDALRARPDLLSEWSVDALPYPSANQWILDEVALWTALGTLPGLTTDDFALDDVPQSGEIFEWPVEHIPAVLGHYYSVNTEAVRHWANQPAA